MIATRQFGVPLEHPVDGHVGEGERNVGRHERDLHRPDQVVVVVGPRRREEPGDAGVDVEGRRHAVVDERLPCAFDIRVRHPLSVDQTRGEVGEAHPAVGELSELRPQPVVVALQAHMTDRMQPSRALPGRPRRPSGSTPPCSRGDPRGRPRRRVARTRGPTAGRGRTRRRPSRRGSRAGPRDRDRRAASRRRTSRRANRRGARIFGARRDASSWSPATPTMQKPPSAVPPLYVSHG